MGIRTGSLLVLAALASSHLAWADTAEVVLHLQGNVDMDQLAKSVSDPASPRYQQYYTPEEIRALGAPSDEDYNNLVQKLQADGAQIVSESSSHTILTVRAERSYLENMETQGNSKLQSLMSFFSKSVVASVHGLEPSTMRRSKLRFAPMTAAQFAGFNPAQIRTAYGFDAIYNAGITGAGEDIAIATYGGFNMGDITDYYSKNGITTSRTVDQVAFNGTPAFDAQSAVETQTDAEFSGMIAPGANIHIFASADNGDTGEIQMFTAILDDGRSKVVNYSWGACESDVTASHRKSMDTIFARAVAQGVNIMIASGDNGSDCKNNGTTVADFPSVEPYVVAVGGTTLDLNGAPSETAWSGSGTKGGSGGGVSTLFGAASFQADLPAPYNAHRSYPDVSFNANPASGEPTWVHFNLKKPTVVPKTAQYVVLGGTSIAAPQWSGFMALVGQARGSKALGFLNPIIYSLAAQNQTTYFNDITSGSNGTYNAGPGWDAVTGWGSMKAEQLLAYLQHQ
jgi:subtilase family serine protease